MLKVKWFSLAKIILADEIEFILTKLNLVAADICVLFVYDFLERLAKNPQIGIFNSKFNCFSIVISKQTIAYYKILDSKKKIELVLFLNNKQNPIHLKKMLH